MLYSPSRSRSRQHRRPRMLAVSLVLPVLAVGLLGGCVPRASPQHSNQQAPSSTPSDSSSRVCHGGKPLEIDGQGIRTEIGGDCGRITVRGNNIVIQVDTATSLEINGQSVTTMHELGAVIVRGNHNHVRAATLGSVDVQGNSNVLNAATAGSVSLSGHHNVVATDRAPGSVSQSGQGNELKRR